MTAYSPINDSLMFDKSLLTISCKVLIFDATNYYLKLITQGLLIRPF